MKQLLATATEGSGITAEGSETATVKKRGRTSRRAARQNRAAPNQHLKVPYITRNIPTYDLLSEANLDKIEAAADTILAEIGIEFRDDPDTVQLFRDAGGDVSPLSDSAWNIKFEPGMIREILKTAPHRFTQHARNPANSVDIGGELE